MVAIFDFTGARTAIVIRCVTIIAFFIGCIARCRFGIAVTTGNFLTCATIGFAFVVEIDPAIGTSGGITIVTFFAVLNDIVAAKACFTEFTWDIAAIAFFAFASG